MMATVSESGWMNNHLALQCLTNCFDPVTQGRANGAWRLLFLDGHDSHVSISFLDACWERNMSVSSFLCT